MSLILASSNEIAVGKPPLWPLYDKEHNVLLCLGDIVEFHELQPNDCVALQSMVYQQMIENPHKLV